jgi:endonuclease-3
MPEVERNTINADKKARALKVIALLEKEYPQAKIALKYKDPMQLLVATILSAQCTDERVNKVTPILFSKYRTAEDFSNADLSELKQEVKPTGFFRNKAKNIKSASRMLVDKFGSNVPKTMEEMLQLPGVARKTANVVLQNAYGKIDGIVVDTHVRRLSIRLGLTENQDANKIEQDLMKIIPKDKWMRFSDLLIFLGRNVCIARKPKCEVCILNKICPSAFTFK